MTGRGRIRDWIHNASAALQRAGVDFPEDFQIVLEVPEDEWVYLVESEVQADRARDVMEGGALSLSNSWGSFLVRRKND